MEKERKGTISIKQFLVRRILRIAPLYYLYFLIGFLVLPIIASDASVAAFNTPLYWDTVKYWVIPSLTFLSNNSGFPGNMTAHLWSISLEMQIYLSLPFLLFYLVHSKTTTGSPKGILAALGALFEVDPKNWTTGSVTI
jgi:peptidoglycan/LPS O-acetylase OafA/YrhL